MSTTEPLNDPAQPDLYWAGHSGWAALPGIVLGGVLSAIVMFGAESLSGWTQLHDEWAAFASFWVVLICWAAMAAIWSYRSASYVYRLTPKRLYLDFGMFSRPTPPIELVHITQAICCAGGLRRIFGVGSVELHATGREPILLKGIYQPRKFADAIRAAAKSAGSKLAG